MDLLYVVLMRSDLLALALVGESKTDGAVHLVLSLFWSGPNFKPVVCRGSRWFFSEANVYAGTDL